MRLNLAARRQETARQFITSLNLTNQHRVESAVASIQVKIWGVPVPLPSLPSFASMQPPFPFSFLPALPLSPPSTFHSLISRLGPLKSS